jgi:putative ABC transport system permease protein
MSSLAGDLRSAVRRLVQHPVLTALALVVVALGTGLTVAVFSVLNGLVLRPLPYREPSRLFVVQEIHRTQGYGGSSFRNYLEWSGSVAAFSSTALLGVTDPAQLTRVDGRELPSGPQEVAIGRVTASFFPMLGVPPALGRWLPQHEQVEGRDDLVVLTHRALERWFGGARDVLGRTLVVDGRRYAVIGVMPKRFHFNYGSTVSAFVPFIPQTTARDARRHATFARLADGVSMRQAREQLTVAASRLARQFPSTNGNWTFALAPLGHASDMVDPPVVRTTQVAFAAALLILAVCGANVASLLLARAVSRSRELAIRVAIGASRAQAARLVIAESVLLSLLGTAAGFPVAYAIRGAVTRLVPAYLDFSDLVSIDAASLAFALVLGAVLGLMCGLAPALRTTSVGPAEVLKGEALSAGGPRGRVLGALVAGEIAVAVVLLVACGLLVRSLAHLRDTPLGYRTSGLLTMALVLPEQNRLPSVPGFYDELIRRVEGLPGVASAATGESLPLSGSYTGLPVLREGRVEPADPRLIRALVHAVTPGYFRTLGISLRRGRRLRPGDGASSDSVTVVSESLARREWTDENPLGRSLRIAGRRWRVVGVVSDVRHRGPLSERIDDDVYVPLSQAPSRRVYLAVRGSGVARLAPDVRRIVRELDSEVAISQVRTIEAALDAAVAEPRARTVWLASLSLVAVLLAVTGLLGSTLYWAAQRSRELAVRQALGADPKDILGLVLYRTLRLAGAGTLLGLGIAGLVGRTMSSLLHGVEPVDPGTYGLVALVIVVAALLVSVMPAARAARADPAAILRDS